MDSSNWSSGIRYYTFDTRPDTEFRRSRLIAKIQCTAFMFCFRYQLAPLREVIEPVWTEVVCGDNRCQAPYETPAFGRFGCKADCGGACHALLATSKHAK